MTPIPTNFSRRGKSYHTSCSCVVLKRSDDSRIAAVMQHFIMIKRIQESESPRHIAISAGARFVPSDELPTYLELHTTGLWLRQNRALLLSRYSIDRMKLSPSNLIAFMRLFPDFAEIMKSSDLSVAAYGFCRSSEAMTDCGTLTYISQQIQRIFPNSTSAIYGSTLHSTVKSSTSSEFMTRSELQHMWLGMLESLASSPNLLLPMHAKSSQ